MWIGGSDEITESEFVWSRSGNKISFTQWLPGYPDNRAEEDCIEMYATSGAWNDMTCDLQSNFICEKLLN